jgi:hypothetical protein
MKQYCRYVSKEPVISIIEILYKLYQIDRSQGDAASRFHYKNK